MHIPVPCNNNMRNIYIPLNLFCCNSEPIIKGNAILCNTYYTYDIITNELMRMGYMACTDDVKGFKIPLH